MSAIATARAALEDVVKTVPGVRLGYVGASIDPPAVVLGAPQLFWDTLQSAPTRAVFPLFVVSRADDRMLERLDDLVPAVSEILGDAGVVDDSGATPTTYTAGATDLPAYVLRVAVMLEGN